MIKHSVTASRRVEDQHFREVFDALTAAVKHA